MLGITRRCNDLDILQALASFHEGRGETAAAKKYTELYEKVAKEK
jgi:hypothetical protein